MQHTHNRVIHYDTYTPMGAGYRAVITLAEVELGPQVQQAIEREHYFPLHEVSMRIGKALLKRLQEVA